MNGIASRSVFVEAGGIRLHAVVDEPPQRAGAMSIPDVLVLHGFTGAAESMEGVARGLAPFARVARLDLVGHGQSDAPDAPAAYAMGACATQVADAARALGFERPHLLGYSMGGRVALAAVIARPEAFASLVLVGATAGIADPTARAERIAADAALADSILQGGLERFVDAWMAQPLFASQARLGPELLLWAAGYAASTASRGGDRVGIATAGSLAHLPWDVAGQKVARLGAAARLAQAEPDELRAAVDPRALDSRSAALGRYTKPPPRRRRTTIDR